MRWSRVAAALAALSMAIPAPASADTTGDAAKIRQLDIMLMVTGLRCRMTRSDFRRDYDRFTITHRDMLDQADRQLRADFTRRYGASGGASALDRMNVHLANSYGRGHPWLDCGQLGQVARNLTQVEGRSTLVEAADQILAQHAPPQFALAR